MENLIRRNRKNKVLITICTILFFVATSCNKRGDVYSHFYELKDAQWSQNDTLYFQIDSTLFSLNKAYELSLEITNNVSYSYQNIWLLIESDLTSDSGFVKIEKEFFLADEFGKWQGSGFGTLYQISFPLGEIRFPAKRNYNIRMIQGMRDENLKGIEKIGIQISEK